MACVVVDHPLVKTRVSALRESSTRSGDFRQRLRELSIVMVCEATRNLECEATSIETPLAGCEGHRLRRPLVIVPILRAGLGMAEAMLSVLPEAVVGHIGLARDEVTLQAVDYYLRLPSCVPDADVLLVDPMLATGNSAAAAISMLKAGGASRIRLISLVGAPEGVRLIGALHPEVTLYLAVIDRGLNEKGYIVPGLGDAGDRYFGT